MHELKQSLDVVEHDEREGRLVRILENLGDCLHFGKFCLAHEILWRYHLDEGEATVYGNLRGKRGLARAILTLQQHR